MVSHDRPACAPSRIRNSKSLRSLRTGTPHSLSWYAMASGLLGQRHRRSSAISGGRDIASEAAVQVEHALAPRAERVFRAEDFARAHDARPLEDGEERVVGVGRRRAADVRLALERGLHRLERTSQALQRVVALGARVLERLLDYLLHHVAEKGVVSRVNALVDVGDDHRQHGRHRDAVHPGIEGLRYAAPDHAAEERRRFRVAVFKVLRNFPGVTYNRLAIFDDGNRLAVRERDGRFVAHAHRLRLIREALMCERHARAPREEAIAPACLTAQFPQSDHAAFFVSLTSWLAGRALMRSSVCSARSRGELRNAWSRPERYCGGQYCGMCWYHADACNVK